MSMLTGAIIGGLAGGGVVLAMALFRKPVKCEACGFELPKFRKPENMDQAMWGGHTCPGCQATLDGRGRVKEEQP